MRKSLIIASSALLLAVGAAHPGNPKLGYDDSIFQGSGGPYEEVASVQPRLAYADTGGYRPCRGRDDDRCIQLNERSVRVALARRARSEPRPAMGGPIEGRSDYPRCSRTLTDECVQRFDRGRTSAPARRAAPGDGASEEPSTPGI